jgi:hypothetical protein
MVMAFRGAASLSATRLRLAEIKTSLEELTPPRQSSAQMLGIFLSGTERDGNGLIVEPPILKILINLFKDTLILSPIFAWRADGIGWCAGHFALTAKVLNDAPEATIPALGGVHTTDRTARITVAH